MSAQETPKRMFQRIGIKSERIAIATTGRGGAS